MLAVTYMIAIYCWNQHASWYDCQRAEINLHLTWHMSIQQYIDFK